MNVCILGCGPAGLLSAFACTQRGFDVTIISKKQKSTIPGAVFLHEKIPGLTNVKPDGVVYFRKHGTKQGYAQKVYGSPDAKCSWDLFPEGARHAWSMFRMYEYLWDTFEYLIHDRVVTPEFLRKRYDFDLMISTIPVPSICYQGHRFDSQNVFILNQAVNHRLDNEIVYNGMVKDNWYRMSKIFGHGSTESTIAFPWDYEFIQGYKIATGYKPITTDCTCFPHVARVGRFGQWKKGVLVHHAYEQTIKLLEGLK